MDQIYYVASLKHGAWWGKDNQWHSERSEAKPMSRLEAVAFASVHIGNRAVPVCKDDLV